MGALFDVALVRICGIRPACGGGRFHWVCALLMAMFLALPRFGSTAAYRLMSMLNVIYHDAGGRRTGHSRWFDEGASPVDLGPALGRGVFDLGLCLDGWSDEPAVDVGGRRQFVFRLVYGSRYLVCWPSCAARPRNRDGLVRHHSISRGLCGRMIGSLVAALGAQGLFVALAITCCVWFACGIAEPPRHRSRLLPLEWQGQTKRFGGRLAQIPGTEVEVSQNEQLAYLKVSKDLLDEAALSDSLIQMASDCQTS